MKPDMLKLGKWASLLVLTIFFLCSSCALAQDRFSVQGYRHTIVYADFKATFQVAELLINTKKLKADKQYYWYSNNAIKITQGGYSGKLLNGTYLEFYINGNLKSQGTFLKGLKNGEWKSWGSDGFLSVSITYREGVMDGAFKRYVNGKLIESGTYRSGKLHGKILHYNEQDSLIIQAYKNGKLREPFTRLKWLKNMIKSKKQP